MQRLVGIAAMACAIAAWAGCGSDGSTEAWPQKPRLPTGGAGSAGALADAGPCGAGTAACGGTCVAIQADATNCGACGKACAVGEVCVSGTCSVQCAATTSLCAGACVDLRTNAKHCGECGNACGQPPLCLNGTCKPPACDDGVKNGTETDVDCGGSCVGCAPGKNCAGRADCAQSATCLAGLCDPLSSGLVGHWKMDEEAWVLDCSTPTVRDSSGNGNDGIACGGVKGGYDGRIGSAGKFDGTGRVQLPASALFNVGANDFTIAVWVSLAQGSDFHAIYDGRPNVAGHLALTHNTSQAPAAGWTFAQRAEGSATIHVFVSEGGVATTTELWHHVALVRQGPEFALVVDGVPVASKTAEAAVMNGTYVNLGWLADNARGLNGMLDDYRIYDRALTQPELVALSE